MSYCNFSAVLKILYSNIDKSSDLDHNLYRATQVDFISKLFEQYTYDNDVIFSASYAAAFFNNKNTAPYKMQLYCKTHFAKFLGDVREYLLTWLIDRNQTANELCALIRSDDTISDEKKVELTDGVNLGDDSALALFFANAILFSMAKPLQPNGARIIFSGKTFLDNLAVENEPPLPCKYFCGRDREIDELHTLLSVHRHIFVSGIAGIGKIEFVKGYVQKYRSHYDRCIYLNYNGDLEAMICELEQSGDSKTKCFSHNYRQLRTLSENTLLIVDNFNTTEAKEPHLYQLLKLKCRIIFTTRSKFECGHTFELKEISDIDTLTNLFLKFCPDITDKKNTIHAIMETVHRHTYAVEIAARVLNRGLISPTELLAKLKRCTVNPHISERVKVVKDDCVFSETYYSHISLL
ncbi:MAG: ATP-binding protein, partial [Clostridia bacterium]|nr:ATP-binding protein [Clostridia bacterium]